MGINVTIDRFTGITGGVSPSSKEFPEDAQTELVNLVPINGELRSRMGFGLFGTNNFYYGEKYYSGCVVDIGTVDYLILHVDTKLIIVSKAYGSITIGSGYPNSNSIMFRVGKHVFIAFDKDDSSGAINYILTVTSNNSYSIRRAGLPDFKGEYLSYISANSFDAPNGSFSIGTYKYMFTFATYQNSGMVSEGSGFDESKFSMTVNVSLHNSKISLTFDPRILNVIPSNATHINIFRTLNIDDVWGKDQIYNDSFNITPIYPWYRLVGKVSLSDIGSGSIEEPYFYVDPLTDLKLSNIFDTYDTRGYKPVGRMKHGICTSNGRIFWMDGVISGRLKFTENSISPNRDNTKYYEHYPEGQGYWIDLNTAGEQSDRGFAISPLGDLMVMQDSRIFLIRDADPLRVNYLGEIKGSPQILADTQHGCINNKATISAPDGRVYVYGRGGYRGFNGNIFDTPDILMASNTVVMNPEFVSAGVYYGSLFRDTNNESCIDQILFSYPKTNTGNKADGLLVIVFDKTGIKFTTYEGLNIVYTFNLPTDSSMVFGDAEMNNTPYIFGTRKLDRDVDTIPWSIRTKDFTHDRDLRLLFLDSVTLYGNKLRNVKIEPLVDSQSVNNSNIGDINDVDESYGSVVSSDFSEASGITVGARITGVSNTTTKIKKLAMNINIGEIFI